MPSLFPRLQDLGGTQLPILIHNASVVNRTQEDSGLTTHIAIYSVLTKNLALMNLLTQLRMVLILGGVSLMPTANLFGARIVPWWQKKRTVISV